jgi:hypothetical protein
VLCAYFDVRESGCIYVGVLMSESLVVFVRVLKSDSLVVFMSFKGIYMI